MRILFLIFSLAFFQHNFAQEKSSSRAGELTLGLRNTVSLFGADKSQVGFGTGAQFRLRLGDRLNTEWFADLLKNSIGSLGTRTDSHIGWSVMFYPFQMEKKVTPYILAGHCFDYTRVDAFGTVFQKPSTAYRWSSAVQAGLGGSFILSDRFDLSLSGQYMIHLGTDIHADIHTVNGVQEMHVEESAHRGLEGHLLLTMSINFKFADLW